MLFSSSLVASALLGFAVATNHEAPPAYGAYGAYQPAAEHTTVAAPAAHETPMGAAYPAAPPAHESSAAPAVHEAPMPPPAAHEAPVVAEHPSPKVVYETTTVKAVHMTPMVEAEYPTQPAVHETTTAAAVHESPAPAPVHETTTAAVVHESPAPAPVHETQPAAGGHASPSLAVGGTVNTHVIQVGGPNGTLVFAPESLVAQPGDLVQFQFNPKNHSVVQSTFDQPCIPIQNVMPNKTDAFFSGFMPSNASAVAAGNILTYTIRVMDSKPIWFYCSQAKHCQGGMVGVINAPPSGNRTLEGYKTLAAAATENLSPGQVAGQGGVESQPSAPSVPETPGATGTVPESPSGTSDNLPIEQTDNAAGRVSQSALGLASSLLVAFMLL